MNNNSGLLDPSLKEAFDRDGYVALRGFLNREEVVELSSEVDRYIRDVVPGLPVEEVFYEQKGCPETLKQLQRIFPVHTELNRETPFHQAHSTVLAGLRNIAGGDDRFYNNIFVKPAGLAGYDHAAQPTQMGGNVFLHGAIPGRAEPSPVVLPEFDSGIKVVEEKDGVFLHIKLDKNWSRQQRRQLVTTKLLGKAAIPALPYEKPDGSSYRIDTDFFGKKRNAVNAYPGPLEPLTGGEQTLKIWHTAVPHL